MDHEEETVTSDNRFSKFYETIVRLFFLPFLVRFFKKAISYNERLHLHITPLNQQLSFGSKELESDSVVHMYLKNPVRFCVRLLLDQRIGLGESYMFGDWDAQPTPHAFLKQLIRSRKMATNVPRKRSRSFLGYVSSFCLYLLRSVVGMLHYCQHRLRANSMLGSARNIRDHYDLGNDMFRLFLDESMTYSCALFDDADLHLPISRFDGAILLKAQMRKYDAIIDRLQLTASDHVLEIGCGWGSCAVRAVQRTGCRWTGLTISNEQFDFARAAIAGQGLQDRVEIKCLDYRLEEETYDKIVSIEMIEAVGHEFLPVFFETIRNRLKPGGIACLQAITIPDDQYDRYRHSSDFIKKHIFPGGHMPCERVIAESLPSGGDLRIRSIDHIGLHYAPTLDHWYRAWMEREASILRLGYSSQFHRKWQYYFALCSSLFAYGHIDVIHMVLQRAEEAD